MGLATPPQDQRVYLWRENSPVALRLSPLFSPSFPLSPSRSLRDNQSKKRRRKKKCHPWHLLCPFSISSRFHGNPKPFAFLSQLCLLLYPRPVWLASPGSKKAVFGLPPLAFRLPSCLRSKKANMTFFSSCSLAVFVAALLCVRIVSGPP